MKPHLKPVSEQTLVITGATSGIGLATARMAAQRGARVFLIARDETALRQVSEGLRAEGARVATAALDVADDEAVAAAALACVDTFGGIDTWVNNAGVSSYAPVWQMPLADARRIFETNYWGLVHGCLAALPHLRERGGALVNVGSVLSDRAVPVQGHYSASKHAVKGITDALRMEVEKEGWPISVSLVKPSAINTPYLEHAGTYLADDPNLPPPVYTPELVAEAILACAETPHRDVTVGGGGRALALMGMLAPRLTDHYMRATMFRQQRRAGVPNDNPREGALFTSLQDAPAVDGNYQGHVSQSSLYTTAKLHPLTTLGAAVAIGAGAALAMRRR
ncbi:MAG TPA: SDR family oxidoreductase [Rhodothermales bacterium]|nr:SDR family oxidoreductase [Rhodothermales bacterium]